MTEVKQVTIETPKQQHTTPEKNRLGFERTFHRFGIVTDKTKIPDKSKSNQIRPLQERARRAEIYKELRSLRKQEQTDTTPDIEALKERKRTLFDEARVRDEVAKQYLTQGEVKVDLPGLGVQTGRYVEISPPESLRTPDTDEKPTIFLIPGIANDIDAVGALAQEFAMFGRKVVVVAFPESIMGNVTPEYAEAVSKSPGYEPQIEFYKKAYLAFRDRHVNNSGIGSGDRQPEMELWGFSTGAPVAAGMLEDPELQEMTTGAVLLNPASSKDMSARELMVGGTIAEIRELKAKKQLLPRYTFTAGRKKGIEQDDKDQKKT